MEIITSIRGGQKLCLEGHMYTKKLCLEGHMYTKKLCLEGHMYTKKLCLEGHMYTKKLCLEGHMYTKKGINKTTIRRECSQRRTRSCKGAVVTDSVIQTVIKKTDHCHDGDNTVKATQLKEELKTKAATTRSTPGQLVSDSAVTTTADVRAALGDVDVLKRTLRRQRAKNNPKNPTSVSDLIIDDTWTTTGGEDPKPFLFYDNGSDARNRMLVFGAPIAH